LVDQNSLQERRLRAAIESVFRRTHGREMTEDERRLFGLKVKGNGALRPGLPQKNSHNEGASDEDGKRRI
jgi:hypothetical protein